MKKYKIILIAMFLALVGCEKDEICIEDNTPKLIIRFFDVEDPSEHKKVINIKVQIEGVDGDYEDPASISPLTDSIAIPIKVTENGTRFKLIITQIADDNSTSENEDIFDLTYRREDLFVTRSCGYKTLFYETNASLVTDDDNWIVSIENVESEQNIVNENSAHVKIFH